MRAGLTAIFAATTGCAGALLHERNVTTVDRQAQASEVAALLAFLGM
jgi:hypothetical protein